MTEIYPFAGPPPKYMINGDARPLSGVYMIRNQLTEREYIGSTFDLRRRWGQHLSTLRGKRHQNPYLQYDYDEMGAKAFVFVVLRRIPPPVTRAQLVAAETEDASNTENSYNLFQGLVL